MRHFLLMVIASLVLVSTCFGEETNKNAWTKIDTALEIATIATLAMDWSQTRTIAKNPDRYYETNPILGKHPNVGTVDLYFAACAVGHAGIAYLLPQSITVLNLEVPVRKVWQLTWIGLEVGAIANNVKAGIKFDF